MNRIKMGQFLKKLRNDKGISQEELANEFAKEYLEVSTNAISSWEKGKTIPDIDKLSFLSDYYKVSIDDILDGEKYEKVDFDSIYHIHQHDYYLLNDFASKVSKKDPSTNLIYYSITEEGEIIRKRFKQHVLDYIEGNISKTNYEELVFFLTNYYFFDGDFDIKTYLNYLKKLKKPSLSLVERWWEAQRNICPINDLTLSFGTLGDEGFLSSTVKRRLNFSEPWEKDELLAMIQIQDPVYDDPERYAASHIEKYEKLHGKKFDRERIIKDTIRFLIENGAMINDEFLSYEESKEHATPLIDILEEEYKKIVKPISIYVRQNEEPNFYYIENTRKNRFFVNYNYDIVKLLNECGYSYEEIFNLVENNETIPDEVYLRFAERNNIDTNREFRLVKADVRAKTDLLYIEQKWLEYRKEEFKDNKNSQKLLNKHEKELSNGVINETTIEKYIVGGTSINEKYKYIRNIRANMSFKDFKNSRKEKKTKELLNALDSLSVEEIRNKFFQKGGHEND